MFEVDRSILVVRPTQAFYDWYISLPDSPKESFAELRESTHSYMLPKIVANKPPSEIIPDDLAHAIFEWELMLHEIDHQYWPPNRTKVDNLIEWFEIQVVPLVVDTIEDELTRHRL
jgi:hypothetical protein